MKTLRLCSWLALVGCLVSCGKTDSVSAPGRPDLVPLAEEFVDCLAAGDFDAAVKRFDTVMTRAMPQEKLDGAWKSVVAGAGPFQQRTGSRAFKEHGFDIVLVSCQFAKAPIDIRIVFDPQGKVTGLWFAPGDQSAAYQSPPYVNPAAFSKVAVVVGDGEWTLPGTLALPEGDGPFPAVVLVHGSGPHDRDETIGPNKPFRDLAEGLASVGIAVLRYEKRTKAHAQKMGAALAQLTVKEETIDDAQAAVRLLHATRRIEAKSIFVLGHSLGGMLIPRIAAGASDLAGLIVMAGTARPLEDVLLEQAEYVVSLEKTKSDEAAQSLNQVKAQVAKMKDPNFSPDTPAQDLPLGTPARYWLDLRDYRPTEAVRQIQKPMLFLQGGRDYQATQADFDLWQKALSGREDVTFKFYPDLNHLFAEGHGKATPAEYLKPAHVAELVIKDIAAWIGQNRHRASP